jgi:hypothetical protein
MSNPQLIARGGKNYPNLLNILSAVAAKDFVFPSNNFILFENPNGDELPGATSFSGVSQALSFVNKTGGAIVADAYFVDPDGSELLAATSGSVADGARGGIGITDLPTYCVNPGSALRIVVTGNALAGSGVPATRYTSRSPDNTFALAAASKATSATHYIDGGTPGAVLISTVVTMFNFGAPTTGDVTFSTYLVRSDGSEELIETAQALVGGTLQSRTFGPREYGAKIKVVFSALPPTGYIYVVAGKIFTVNDYSGTPEL